MNIIAWVLMYTIKQDINKQKYIEFKAKDNIVKFRECHSSVNYEY